jgi:hypothetical protein
MSVSYRCCVFTDRGLSVWMITRPEMSYGVWCVWVWSWSPLRGGHELPSGRSEGGVLKRLIITTYTYVWWDTNCMCSKRIYLKGGKVKIFSKF